MTKAAVSRHVAFAHKNGWLNVQQSAASRREHEITLTAAGRRLVNRGRKLRTEAEQRAVTALGRRDMERTTHTLALLADLLEGGREVPDQ